MLKSFYEGKTILLTGATGFLGKVVLEKIMRSLPGVKTIYLAISPKVSEFFYKSKFSNVCHVRVLRRTQSISDCSRKFLTQSCLIVSKLSLECVSSHGSKTRSKQFLSIS